MVLEPFMLFPAPAGSGLAIQDSSQPLKVVEFETSDDVTISGLFFEPENARGVILFCHGNGEWLGTLEQYVVQVGTRFDCAVLAFDYRGYGDSEGKCSAEGIMLDGQAAYDFLIGEGYQPQQVVVYGRSLGGAVATFIGSENEVGGLALRSTFSDLTDVAAAKFPWLPVRLLMRNRIDSSSRIAKYEGRLLQRHGTADKVVPIRFGRKLFDAAQSTSDKKFIVEEGADHFTIPTEKFWSEFQKLIDEAWETNYIFCVNQSLSENGRPVVLAVSKRAGNWAREKKGPA